MEDNFVPERHLGLWKEEGRSPWAAFLTRWPPVGYPPREFPKQVSYSVRLDRGQYGMTGKFFWAPTHDLSVERPTPEEAKLVAASAIDEMIANLRVIAASLRGEPDTDQTTPPPK